MTDRQNEKLNMYQTVLEYCREHADVYARIPAFGRYVDELENCIDEIRFTEKQQSGAIIKGVTKQKGNAEDVLVQICLTVAGALYPYAFEQKNAELMEKSSLNENMLYKAHGNQTLSMAKNIAEAAAELTDELADYGITDADRDALDEAIAAYKALIVSPRAAIKKRKQHTGNLVQQIAATDSLFYDQLDKLVVRFKTANPSFYNGYKSARSINDSYRRRNDDKKDDESPAPETE